MSHHRRPSALALCRCLLAIAALPLSHGPARAASKVWEKKYEVSARPAVNVRTGDGSVIVTTGAAGVVQVRVEYEAQRWGFTSSPGDPAVTLEQKGSEITVAVREPSWFAVFGGISERLEIRITIPEECDLRVKTGDGSVNIAGPVSGRLDLATGDGRVTLRKVRGNLKLASGDGVLDGEELGGSIAAATQDGKVALEGRFDAVDVRSQDGRVRVAAGAGSSMSREWRLETQDSPLTLLIPRDFKAELEASTRDGRLDFQLPVTVPGGVGRRSIRGKINGGGPVLRVRSGDGSLTIGVSN